MSADFYPRLFIYLRQSDPVTNWNLTFVSSDDTFTNFIFILENSFSVFVETTVFFSFVFFLSSFLQVENSGRQLSHSLVLNGWFLYKSIFPHQQKGFILKELLFLPCHFFSRRVCTKHLSSFFAVSRRRFIIRWYSSALFCKVSFESSSSLNCRRDLISASFGAVGPGTNTR